MLILDLLHGKNLKPHELYLALKETNSKGGLGKSFTIMPRKGQITDAFEIDDKQQTVIIKDATKLFRLATYYQKGEFGLNKNKKKYVLCLALITMQTEVTDLADCRIALQKMQTYFKGLGKNVYDKDTFDTANELIQKRLDALDTLLNATVIQKKEIVSSIAGDKDVLIPTQLITLTNKQQYDSKVINKRIAAMETFVSYVMSLYLGNLQPDVLQQIDTIDSQVNVLSKRSVGARLDLNFREWMQSNFKGAGWLDVAAIFLAENNYSKQNVVLTDKEKEVVRFNFNACLNPLTQDILDGNRDKAPKLQKIRDVEYSLPGMFARDGFALKAEDFDALPFLTERPLADLGSIRYVPAVWWLNEEGNSDQELSDALSKLNQSPQYLAEKFSAILEMMVIPVKVYEKIAESIIRQFADRVQVLKWIEARRDKLCEIAKNIKGFHEFFLKASADTFALAKQKLIEFAQANPLHQDIFPVSETAHYLKYYDDNYTQIKQLFPPLPPQAVQVQIQPEAQIEVELPEVKYIQILDKMHAVNAQPTLLAQKAMQIGVFKQGVNQLDLSEVAGLLAHLNDVQAKKAFDPRFATLRHERTNIFGAGNTASWYDILYFTQNALIAKLHDAFEVGPQVQHKMQTDEFEYYFNLLNQPKRHFRHNALAMRFKADFELFTQPTIVLSAPVVVAAPVPR